MVMAEFQNPALEDRRGEHKTSSIKRFFSGEGKCVHLANRPSLQMQEALLE